MNYDFHHASTFSCSFRLWWLNSTKRYDLFLWLINCHLIFFWFLPMNLILFSPESSMNIGFSFLAFFKKLLIHVKKNEIYFWTQSSWDFSDRGRASILRECFFIENLKNFAQRPIITVFVFHHKNTIYHLYLIFYSNIL